VSPLSRKLAAKSLGKSCALTTGSPSGQSW